LKNELEAKGAISKSANGKASVFTDNLAFSSPSSAAAVIAGRAANGRKSWKVAGSGLTYGAWQDSKLEAAAPDIPKDLD